MAAVASDLDMATRMFQGLGWPTSSQENIKKSIYALKMKNNIGFTSKGIGCAVEARSQDGKVTAYFLLTSIKAVSHKDFADGQTLTADRYCSNFPKHKDKENHRVEISNLPNDKEIDDFAFLPLDKKPEFYLVHNQCKVDGTITAHGGSLFAYTFVNKTFVQVKFEYNKENSLYERKEIVPPAAEDELSMEKLVGAPVIADDSSDSPLVVGVLGCFESNIFRPILFKKHPDEQSSKQPQHNENSDADVKVNTSVTEQSSKQPQHSKNSDVDVKINTSVIEQTCSLEEPQHSKNNDADVKVNTSVTKQSSKQPQHNENSDADVKVNTSVTEQSSNQPQHSENRNGYLKVNISTTKQCETSLQETVPESDKTDSGGFPASSAPPLSLPDLATGSGHQAGTSVDQDVMKCDTNHQDRTNGGHDTANSIPSGMKVNEIKAVQEEARADSSPFEKVCIRQKKIMVLSQEVWTRLSVKLDPERRLGGDYRTLADKLGYSMDEIVYFGSQTNPTFTLLQAWWPKENQGSIEQLCSALRQSERTDVVDLIEEWIDKYGCNCEKCGDLK